MLEQAYAGRLESVQINPHMDKDKVNNKVTANSAITVADIFPISSSKVKKFMTLEKSQKLTIKSVFVAPKSLVVTIVEEKTNDSLQGVFDSRAKDAKDSRGSS